MGSLLESGTFVAALVAVDEEVAAPRLLLQMHSLVLKVAAVVVG